MVGVRGRRKRLLAFSLVELMVAIAIILLLASLVLAAVVRGRDKAWSVGCLNHMRGMAGDAVESGRLPDGSQFLGQCTDSVTYAVNSNLSSLSQPRDLGKTVLLYESASGASRGDGSDVAHHHLGGSNFAFCDGHAKWSKEMPNFRP